MRCRRPLRLPGSERLHHPLEQRVPDFFPLQTVLTCFPPHLLLGLGSLLSQHMNFYECMTPDIHMLKPDPQCDRRRAFGGG